MASGISLGAPGVYRVPFQAPPVPGAVRLDITGFVGIAQRGPVGVPVLVETWDGYVRTFGQQGAECPGLLGYAVEAFFRQGGARASVVRVAPPAPSGDGNPTATHILDASVCSGQGQLEFAARGEGAWGNGLSIRLDVTAGPEFPINPCGQDTQPSKRFIPPEGLTVPRWSLLLIHGDDSKTAPRLSWAEEVTLESTPAPPGDAAPGTRRPVVTTDTALPVGDALAAAIVTGTMQVTDDDGAVDRTEILTNLGLRPQHPRWIAKVVCTDSRLVVPIGAWRLADADPLNLGGPLPLTSFSVVENPGFDRYDGINADSFFDADDAPSDLDADATSDPCDVAFTDVGDGSDDAVDPIANAAPVRHRGVDALIPAVDELGLLVVPDLLYEARNWTMTPPVIPPPAPQPQFGPCQPLLSLSYAVAPPALTVLDGAADRDEIHRRQSRLIRRTGSDRSFVVLLDTPPGLPADLVLGWRAGFDTSFAAAYHPWLRIPTPDGQSMLVPPSGFAAGIIAARELRVGVPWGPANELALEAVSLAQVVTDEQHGALHRDGVNVFRPDADGVRLTGARTLSRDRAYRQLSVRRVMTQLRLTIAQRLAWAVFEPHTQALRTAVRLQLTTLLRDLYRAGALAGASEAEAFFVRCDDSNNPPASIEQGRVVAEVGVRPVEPIEFLLVRVALEANGGVTVGEGSR